MQLCLIRYVAVCRPSPSPFSPSPTSRDNRALRHPPRIFSLFADCKRFPPAGMHSLLRACVMKYLGLRVVVEGKQEPGTTYAYVGVGLAGVEQLLLASVRKHDT